MVGGHASLRSSGGATTAATRGPARRTASRTAANTKREISTTPAATSATGATAVSLTNPTAAPQTRSRSSGAASTSTTSKAKLTAPLRSQWMAQAVAADLHGRRAAAWMATWDKGSTVRRVSLLEALKQLHADSNSNTVEEDLGDAAPLLFARLTSWWKLRYGTWAAETAQTARANSKAAASAPSVLKVSEVSPSGASTAGASTPLPTSELLAQVEGITVFVRGSRYLLQFVEGGGTAALCDCLEVTSTLAVFGDVAGAMGRAGESAPPSSSTPQPAALASDGANGGGGNPQVAGSEEARTFEGYARERRAITLLLLHIANSGRVYREMVGEVDNLLHILHALLRETDTAVAHPLTELLAVLGKGHPRLSASVQTGLVRVLASALPPLLESTAAESQQQQHQQQQQSVSSSSGPALPSSSADNAVVVLSTARAIRALQLQVEQHHFAQFTVAVGAGGDGVSRPGRGSGADTLTTAAAGMIDYVPIIGLDNTVTANSFAGVTNTAGVAGGVNRVSGTSREQPVDALLRPFTTAEYLDTLFRLALAEQHTAYRVEGNELLNLAAKNIQLTPKILTRCLDVVDDDVYTLEGADGGEGEAVEGGASSTRLRRQRRQLSCGRAAVLILISRPMTRERRDLLLQLVGQRGGHLTLLKYLRLTQHGDTAAVVDCCHALQFIARSSMELQQRRLGGQAGLAGPRSTTTTSEVVLVRMTEGIQSALGEAVLQLLLFQELSEEDCMAVLRSARAAVVGRAE